MMQGSPLDRVLRQRTDRVSRPHTRVYAGKNSHMWRAQETNRSLLTEISIVCGVFCFTNLVCLGRGAQVTPHPPPLCL